MLFVYAITLKYDPTSCENYEVYCWSFRWCKYMAETRKLCPQKRNTQQQELCYHMRVCNAQ